MDAKLLARLAFLQHEIDSTRARMQGGLLPAEYARLHGQLVALDREFQEGRQRVERGNPLRTIPWNQGAPLAVPIAQIAALTRDWGANATVTQHVALPWRPVADGWSLSAPLDSGPGQILARLTHDVPGWIWCVVLLPDRTVHACTAPHRVLDLAQRDVDRVLRRYLP